MRPTRKHPTFEAVYGYDDPYLTDEDYQTLCNMVCEHVPGMTVQAWRDSTLGQRVAFLRTALEKQGRRVSETTDVVFLHIAAHDLLAFLAGLKRLVIGYCDDLACGDPTRREQRLAASEKVIGEWREKDGSTVASLRERLRHIPVRRSTPVMIDDRSRKNATGWLVELADLACTLIVHNERWREEIDVRCRHLAIEMSIDFERLWAEIGVELDHVSDRKEATKMTTPKEAKPRCPNLHSAGIGADSQSPIQARSLSCADRPCSVIGMVEEA